VLFIQHAAPAYRGAKSHKSRQVEVSDGVICGNIINMLRGCLGKVHCAQCYEIPQFSNWVGHKSGHKFLG
jgi:hypothetical protein